MYAGVQPPVTIGPALLPDDVVTVPYDQTLFVSAGDLFGTGTPQLVISPDEGGGPRVKVMSPAVLANFFASDADARGGVPVAVKDVGGDGRADVVTGSDPGGASVRACAGPTLGRGAPDALFVYDAADLMNGVYVG